MERRRSARLSLERLDGWPLKTYHSVQHGSYYQIDSIVVCFKTLFNNLEALFSRKTALRASSSRENAEDAGIVDRPKSFSHSKFLLIESLGALSSRNSARGASNSCNNAEGVGIFGRAKSFSHSRFLFIDSSGSRNVVSIIVVHLLSWIGCCFHTSIFILPSNNMSVNLFRHKSSQFRR